MILGDKILALRKKSGMSQEELADKMAVSRQSISKWESSASIPDINKILELAKIFEVSTDYLLKDDMENIEFTDSEDAEGSVRVSLNQAKDFLAAKAKQGRETAFAVVLCILSPIVLILLAGASETHPWNINISEQAAAGIGLMILLLMVAAAVAIFIISGSKMRRFEYMRGKSIELEYGVSGILKEKLNEYEGKYTSSTVTAVILCIISAVPLLLAGILEASDMLCIVFTDLLIIIVSVAVSIFITSGSIKASYDRLLGKGEYSEEYRRENKKEAKFAGFYWPVITAIYLAWSFVTNNWQITWVVWPVAALLFAGISAIVKQRD